MLSVSFFLIVSRMEEVFMAKAIIPFGPPGVGKGTVSNVLKLLGYGYASPGQHFRELTERAQAGDLEAKQIYDCMNGANPTTLVPIIKTMNVVRKLVSTIPVEQSFIFDTARSGEQVKIFTEDIVADRALDQVIGVYLNAPADICRQRLGGRSLKESRSDDRNQAIVDKRFRDYDQYAEDTIEGLKRYTTYIEVDASYEAEEVIALFFTKLSLLRPSNGFVDQVNLLTQKQQFQVA
jgi:adenylate kinase family enzyme